MRARTSRQHAIFALAGLLFAGCAASPAYLEPPQFIARASTTISVIGGQRTLDKDFKPADEATVWGVDFDVREVYDTLGFEFGYLQSRDTGHQQFPGTENLEARSFLHEIYGGGRWQFDPWTAPIKPYVGVGLSAMHGNFEIIGSAQSTKEAATTLGLYAHAGVKWNITDHVNIALDAREMFSAKASLQTDTTFDYTQLMLMVGWTF